MDSLVEPGEMWPCQAESAEHIAARKTTCVDVRSRDRMPIIGGRVMERWRTKVEAATSCPRP